MKYFNLIIYFVLGLLSSQMTRAQESEPIQLGVIPANDEQDLIHFGILLPPSYEKVEGSYPVIYYLHGMNQYYASPRAQWMASFFMDQFKEGDLPEFIMVFVDGGEGFWCDHFDGNPLVETELMNYLIPYVDKEYSTDTSRRLIMGWSAGGAGALTFYTKHPEEFTAVISLDGILLTWEDFQHRIGERPQIISDSAYFYTFGSPYEWVKTNASALLEKKDTSLFLAGALLTKDYQQFLSMLGDLGIPATYTEVGCGHEFRCVFAACQERLLPFITHSLSSTR
jgi:enterochelin esterase-like enzyme